ncbi:hypothetical protein SALBM311S_02848 [Streptomyces alboniger]
MPTSDAALAYEANTQNQLALSKVEPVVIENGAAAIDELRLSPHLKSGNNSAPPN